MNRDSVTSVQTTTGEDHKLRADLKRCCDKLWDEQIRSDLIYEKGLMICKMCLGLFYLEDKSANHPTELTVPISKACTDSGITSADGFFNCIYSESINALLQFGKYIMPRMSPVHIEPPKPATTSTNAQGNWNKSRIAILEQEVQNLRGATLKLEAEKLTLQNDLKAAIERLLTEKTTLTRIKLKAETHLIALDDLLHPEGCCCQGKCDETPQNKSK